jgi:integrase
MGAKRKTRRSKGEGTYWYDQKTKQHRYRLRHEGRDYTISDPDRSRAQAALEQLKLRLQRNQDIDGGKQTLREFLTYWLDAEIRRNVGASTLHDYKKRIEIYITPTLGDYRLCDITPRLIRQWVNAVRDTYALSSARQALAILKRALGLAFDEKLIDYNPAASVRLGSSARKPAARDDAENGRALSADQVTKLLNEAQRLDKHQSSMYGSAGRGVRGDGLYVLYTLAVRLGLRRGELLGLRWADIDFDTRTLKVRQQVVRMDNVYHISDTLKTPAARRTLPLTDDLVALLREHKLHLGARAHVKDLVFPDHDGNERDPNSITRNFARLVARLELGDFHLHDLRATAITRWRELGVDLEVVGALAGHEHTDTTANIYSDPHMERKRAAVEKHG